MKTNMILAFVLMILSSTYSFAMESHTAEDCEAYSVISRNIAEDASASDVYSVEGSDIQTEAE